MYLVPDETMRCPILLGRDSWMRFHSRSYQTLPSTPDGRVLGELNLAHICDNNVGGASAYQQLQRSRSILPPNLRGNGMSLNTIPQITLVNLVRRDGSPVLTGHFMVNFLTLTAR